MAIPRPKILSVITVPTGGWTFRLAVSAAGNYDTDITATVAAGDYFLAWDMQSDDLFYELMDKIEAAIVSAGVNNVKPYFYFNSSNRVVIGFDTNGGFSDAVKLKWTLTTAALAGVLGFSTAADTTSTAVLNPSFTADYDPAYCWFAEEDGQLANHLVEESSMVKAVQSISLSGRVTTQRLARTFEQTLELAWLTRERTFSRDTAYSTAPVPPYYRNRGLECWWKQAQTGTRFRVYRDGIQTSSMTASQQTNMSEAGVLTAASSTTLTDTAKAFSVEPQTYKSSLIKTYNADLSHPVRMLISSHTATVFTLPTQPFGIAWGAAGQRYYTFDQRYTTCVVDLMKMMTFLPQEIAALDRYNISIPLLRYV
jgi:hypothetical protein